ncbi:uncharacterized protein LOC144437329 [Glandiceps talaboti]
MEKAKTVLFVGVVLALMEGAISREHHRNDDDEHVISHDLDKRELGDCGGSFYADTGTLASPGYPSYYSDSQHCSYYITTASGLPIMLTFIVLATEYDYDYVYVYDGPTTSSPIIGEYTGTSIPTPIFSTGSDLAIVFWSDSSSTDQGFYAIYTTITGDSNTYIPGDCGGSFTLDIGGFGSPGYPSYYDNYQDCYYYITVSPGNTIELEFSYFSLEECCDYVEIFDGISEASVSLGQYYSIPNYVITSSGSNLVVYFHSDSSTTDLGFYATYKLGPGNDYYACGGTSTTVYSNGGIILSHDPSFYPSYTTCTQTIFANGHYDNVYLKFIKIDLIYSYGCSSDYITVTDAYGTVQGIFCDYTSTTEFTTDSGSLTVAFTAGYHYTSYGGFEAIFTLYSNNYGTCYSYDFNCNNDWCIDNALRCDGNNHCSDYSDEVDCDEPADIGAIVGGVVGAIFVLIVIIAIVACCCCCSKKSSSTAPSTTTPAATTQPNTGSTIPTVTYHVRMVAPQGYSGGYNNQGYNTGPPPIQGQTNTAAAPVDNTPMPQSMGYNPAQYPPPKSDAVGYNPVQHPPPQSQSMGYNPTQHPPPQSDSVGYNPVQHPPPQSDSVGYNPAQHPPPQSESMGYNPQYPPPQSESTGYNPAQYPPPQSESMGYNPMYPPQQQGSAGYNPAYPPATQGVNVPPESVAYGDTAGSPPAMPPPTYDTAVSHK